jgi:hypothetical protein
MKKGTLIGWLVALAIAVGLLFWLFAWLDTWHLFTQAIGQEFFVRHLFPTWDPLHWTPLAYFAVVIAALIFGSYALLKFEERIPGSGWTAIGCVVLCLASLVMGVRGTWDNHQDAGQWYNQATNFIVEDTDNLPISLEPVIDQAQPSDGECAFTTHHDVPSCIKEGVLPDEWAHRTSSMSGAEIVMSRTSEAAPNTELMSETMMFRNDIDSWTAIRDGKNKQPIFGIVEWNGGDDTTTCRFKDDYAIDYAFGGRWGSNLANVVANHYPTLFYETSDMWGYCKDNDGEREPVIVIPVTDEVSFHNRTVRVAAGVLEITGSSSGEPVIKHITDIEAGDYPGPVYPASLTAMQREALEWAAGKGHRNRLNFGYEPLDVASQAGNRSEYLLEDTSGGLFWVTPLKAKSSDSQQIVAYSITSADTVEVNGLNEQNVYVLSDGDERIVNLSDMEARVEQALREENPGFYSGNNPGKLTEFLPLNSTTWQAYAELGGRVVYRIEVSTDAQIATTVESIGAIDESESNDSEISCADPTQLTEPQLADCIAQFTDELVGRSQD